MSRRQIIPKFLLLDAVDSTASPTSESTVVDLVDFITYQLKIDSTVNSILQVEFCNDKVLFQDSLFYPLDFKEVLNLVGATEEDYTIKISNHGFKNMRLKITNNGGTGNISAWITGTSVGA